MAETCKRSLISLVIEFYTNTLIYQDRRSRSSCYRGRQPRLLEYEYPTRS